jgi:hypothetical protein
MPELLQLLVQKYRVFYEVLPYHVVIEKAHGSPEETHHTVQAGFDVDVHGLSNKAEIELPPPGDYALGCAELKTIADTVAQHASESSVEVIDFPSTVFSEAGENFRSEAVIRIRISHNRGIDQPVGLQEEDALKELERQLQRQGIRRR